MIEHDQEIQIVDELARRVAGAMPFPVELEADMGGTFALQLQLGRRGGIDDSPDRAGIDPGEGETWWLDVEGGRETIVSDLGRDTDPAVVAEWITNEAQRVSSPASLATSLVAGDFPVSARAATSSLPTATVARAHAADRVDGVERGR